MTDLIIPPAVEPWTADEVARELKQFETSELERFQSLIKAARIYIENVTGRQLLQATRDLVLDRVPCGGWIDIPRPPLQSVTSITYVDTNGVTQTWAASNYLVTGDGGTFSGRGRITLAEGVSWPVVESVAGSLVIRFVCGYGEDPTDVPEDLRRAILLHIQRLYDGSDTEATVRAHYKPYVSLPVQVL